MHSDFQDYFLTVTPPVLSGGLYIALGLIIWYFLTARAGLGPLLSFHCAAGLLLITLPFPPYNLAMACFLPAALVHMAWNFPPIAGQRMPSRLWISMYGFSALLAVFYLLIFSKDSGKSAAFHYLLACYAVAAAGVAVYRWVKAAASDYSDPARIIARSLLAGIGSACLLSSFALVAIRLSGVDLHHTVIAPISLLFPLCLLVGVLLAERQQSRWQLVQTEKMATMGSLLAGLAHEINNPLNFIYANIELLQEYIAELRQTLGDPEGKGEKIFSRIDATVKVMDEGATRARDIVNNLRYFSYAGKQQRELVDVNSSLEHSVALLAPKWKGRLRIVRRYGEIPRVRGFPGDLGQVFLNVLANACDATPKRGVIRIRTWRESDPAVTVSIRDSGMGIKKNVLPRVFDPFFTTKQQGEGTGLGLAICLQLLQKHQGKIEVKSDWGKGTEVRITLPLAPAPSARELEDEEEANIPLRKEV